MGLDAISYYLQELVQVCKSGTSTDILLCFDVHGLESSPCESPEEAGVQSHVCVMLDVNSTEGDDDWGVRLVDPAPTRRRVWTCRGETLMSAMQGPPAEACCGIWILRANGQEGRAGPLGPQRTGGME
eukprot:CAMPEP_0172157236 /NCGR_PEP_ID=MMETSP1050-20130122/3671_1 /TAXON_ID=233186 /ORGANISM="Cryptomonas curvata, Strain CCAP979/52" /LENGTH=127 /DNA_ID=CAMNT_0012826427 /DNA_START=184 /DNA_END=565 /DNA_ORIENTATION=+